MKIFPSSRSINVTVKVTVSSLLGVRLADNVGSGEVVNFDVKARMEEKERRSGWVNVGFALKVGTKPNVVKYEVEGAAILEGKDEEIKKMLEVNPETQVPFVFQRVYQHVFMSMYLLATLIDAPYPPPNLFHLDQQQPPMSQVDTSITSSSNVTMQTEQAVGGQEEAKTSPPASTDIVSQKETPVQPTASVTPQEETATLEKEKTVESTTEAQESNIVQQNREKPIT